MVAFLAFLQEKHGGAEEYLKRFCHLTDDDIKVIRENLLASRSKA